MGKTGFKGRHDGDCLPCIIRRAALDHAGLEDVDVDYLMDVFTQFTDLRIGTRTLIADYLRFGQYIRSLAGADLVLYAPDLSVCAKGVEPQRLVEMYQKHAREVSDCFCNWCDSATLEILGPLL
jgi:hypothetical protein